MHWKSRSLIAAAALLLTIPAGAATWYSSGSFEPDSTYDTPQYMFQNAPQTAGKRVYFNAYTVMVQGAVSVARVNPNVGALETRNEVPNSEMVEAVLGVWTDCNLDGYIGMAETAVREYPAQLLPANTPCAPVTGSPNGYPASKPHNYNGYVTELIPIARDSSTRDARRYFDGNVTVWGDFNKPDERPRGSCALRPFPRGTLESSGGILEYLDCRQDVLGAWNTAVDAAGDPAGLRFGDTNDARSGQLGQISTFGPEDSQYSPVNAWDCSGGSEAFLFRSGDVINETPLAGIEDDQEQDVKDAVWTAHDITVYPVSTNPVGNTEDPSVPAFVNATSEGSGGDCDTTNDRGADFYGTLEADFNGVDPNNKREADWNFNVTGTNRGGAPVSLLGPLGGPGNAGWDEGDLGVRGTTQGGVRWTTNEVWLSKPGPETVRSDLGSGTAEISPAYHLSFYAYVPAKLIDLGLQLPGGTGKYGSAQCGLNTSGIHNGWNCDPSTWYTNPDGTSISDGLGLLARVGEAYNLRDVDCYDGGNSLGAGTQPAFYGANPCP